MFVEVARQGDHARVIVDSVDDWPVHQCSQTKLTVINPSLQNTAIQMQQTAPGRYEAELQTDKSGAYQLELEPESTRRNYLSPESRLGL